MKKLEAKFTTQFLHYAKKYLPTGAYEIKHTRGKDAFAVRELKEHQYNALSAASKNSLAYKIPDDGTYKPFDMFLLRRAKAFVVIAFPDNVAVINIDNFPRTLIRITEPLARVCATYFIPKSKIVKKYP